MIRFPETPDRTFAEFSAGFGLMRIGLERRGWRIGCANDICSEKFEMYRQASAFCSCIKLDAVCVSR